MQSLTKLTVTATILCIVLSNVNSKPTPEVDSSPVSLQCSGSTSSQCVNEQCTVSCSDGQQVQLRCSGGSVSINSNNVGGQSSSVQAECGKKIKFRSCFPYCGGESVIEEDDDVVKADSGLRTVPAGPISQNDESLTSSSSSVVRSSSSSSSSTFISSPSSSSSSSSSFDSAPSSSSSSGFSSATTNSVSSPRNPGFFPLNPFVNYYTPFAGFPFNQAAVPNFIAFNPF